jgi:Tol biopolymer transport system component
MPPRGTPSSTPIPDSAGAWILFEHMDFETGARALQRVRPGTDDPVPALPAGPSGAGMLADWSPDGARFAFTAWDPPPSAGLDPASTADLWVAAWDGGSPARLVDCATPCWMIDSPAWSPDGRRIAFSRTDAVAGTITGSAVQIFDLASGRMETILDTEPPAVVGVWDWSGDGRSLLVGEARLTSTRIAELGSSGASATGTVIAVVDLAAPGSDPRRLPAPDFAVNSAAWHPTEDLIVFDAGRIDYSDPAHSTSELFTVRPDGTGLAQLTDTASVGAFAFAPSWSPDGSTILFTLWHRASYTPTLASIRPDGTGLEELGEETTIVGWYPRQRPIPATP